MWTKLIGTPEWNAAQLHYSHPDRHYHNISHINRMYDIAAFVKLQYDEDLDRAILRHDVIYDNQPKKEKRSAEWLDGTEFEASQKTKDLIVSTETHELGNDNRLIFLDLYDLSYEKLYLKNRELVKLEAIALYDISEEEFYVQNSKFMLELANRIENSLFRIDQCDRYVYEEIISNIRYISKES